MFHVEDGCPPSPHSQLRMATPAPSPAIAEDHTPSQKTRKKTKAQAGSAPAPGADGDYACGARLPQLAPLLLSWDQGNVSDWDCALARQCLVIGQLLFSSSTWERQASLRVVRVAITMLEENHLSLSGVTRLGLAKDGRTSGCPLLHSLHRLCPRSAVTLRRLCLWTGASHPGARSIAFSTALENPLMQHYCTHSPLSFLPPAFHAPNDACLTRLYDLQNYLTHEHVTESRHNTHILAILRRSILILAI